MIPHACSECGLVHLPLIPSEAFAITDIDRATHVHGKPEQQWYRRSEDNSSVYRCPECRAEINPDGTSR